MSFADQLKKNATYSNRSSVESFNKLGESICSKIPHEIEAMCQAEAKKGVFQFDFVFFTACNEDSYKGEVYNIHLVSTNFSDCDEESLGYGYLDVHCARARCVHLMSVSGRHHVKDIDRLGRSYDMHFNSVSNLVDWELIKDRLKNTLNSIDYGFSSVEVGCISKSSWFKKDKIQGVRVKIKV